MLRSYCWEDKKPMLAQSTCTRVQAQILDAEISATSGTASNHRPIKAGVMSEDEIGFINVSRDDAPVDLFHFKENGINTVTVKFITK